MKKRDDLLRELQSKLGTAIKNIDYLDVALTHSSYAKQKKSAKHYERMEFLGDSVLQLCISDVLFNSYSDEDEGELTKQRALIVCENSLYELAKSWNLGEYILMSKGEELTGGRERVSILADCVEAVIAAVYLDSGFESSKEFIEKYFRPILDRAIKNQIVLDYKTKLQEKLQAEGDVSIVYNLVKFEGPPHRRKFYSQVLVNDVVMGDGVGFSKKESQQKAAKGALEKLEDGNE